MIGKAVWFKFRTSKRRKSGIVVGEGSKYLTIYCKRRGGHYCVDRQDVRVI